MSHRTFTSFCLIFLFVDLFMFVLTDQKNITAESGQNVTLTCRAPNNNIISVEWSRADLGDEYVLLYRNEHFDPDGQHPSFKNRVDLQDRQMKDGDVSLILKDVTINDTGTYECQVIQQERSGLNSINNITLTVVPPGQPGGDTEDGGQKDGGQKDGGQKDGGQKDGGQKDRSFWLKVCVPVLVVLVVGVGGVLCFVKWKKNKKKTKSISVFRSASL